jgi:hypothetical protein
MGVTGERFLELSRAEALEVSVHALDRLCERVGFRLTTEEAIGLFQRGRQVKADEMILLGYRPAYGRRLHRGRRSWYFLLPVHGAELIAVVSQSDGEGEFAWVTTYAPNAQTDELRMASYDALALVGAVPS